MALLQAEHLADCLNYMWLCLSEVRWSLIIIIYKMGQRLNAILLVCANLNGRILFYMRALLLDNARINLIQI